jgi:hypothetical protein
VPDCRHCDAAFEDDDAYAAHLEAEHADELGAIDRRRIAAHAESNERSSPVAPLVIGIVVLGGVAVLVAAWLAFAGGSGGGVDAAQEPTAVGSVHYHGAIEVTVAGETVDFSRDQFQYQDDAFHFENGDGSQWHAHAQGVTLEYAMGTLGFDVTQDSVTYDGTTYRDGADGTSVTVTVDGDPVVPREYVLQESDRIRIVVET